eukprot:9501822-Pyramimonas_sp.AAC.2
MQYQLEEFVDTQNNHRTGKAVPALEACVERMTTSLARCGAEVRGGLEGIYRGSRGVDRMTTSLTRCGAEVRGGLEAV